MFLIITQLGAVISQIYFGRKFDMFRTVPLPIVRSFSLYTQQWYVIQVMLTACEQEHMLDIIDIIINQLDALISPIYFGRKLYMFRTVPLPIVRSFSLYTQQWYMSYRLC